MDGPDSPRIGSAGARCETSKTSPPRMSPRASRNSLSFVMPRLLREAAKQHGAQEVGLTTASGTITPGGGATTLSGRGRTGASSGAERSTAGAGSEECSGSSQLLTVLHESSRSITCQSSDVARTNGWPLASRLLSPDQTQQCGWRPQAEGGSAEA